MSVEDAKEFLKKIEQDSAFKKSLQNITNDQGKKVLEKHGFQFTEDEFIEAYNDLKGGELRNEELSQIAGGTLPGAQGGVALSFSE